MTERGLDPSLPHGSRDEISLYALLRIVLQCRYLILGAATVTAVIAVAFVMIGDRSYTAEAAFMPQAGGERLPGGAAALASQLGMTVGGAGEQAPSFYVELLKSRQILSRVLYDTFAVAADTVRGFEFKRGTIAELLEVEGENELLIHQKARGRLQNAVEANVERGMVRLAVTTRWPDLSESIARRLIELVEEFNVATRQSSAAAEGEFLDARMSYIDSELRQAEEELRHFLEANRQFQNSPQLVFEHDRLQRRVAMHQQVYTALAQSHESAQSAAVRDTPLITIVEPPERPVYPDSRSVPLIFLLGLFFGGILSTCFALIREIFRSASFSGDREYEQFQAAWDATLTDLRLTPRRGTSIGQSRDAG